MIANDNNNNLPLFLKIKNKWNKFLNYSDKNDYVGYVTIGMFLFFSIPFFSKLLKRKYKLFLFAFFYAEGFRFLNNYIVLNKINFEYMVPTLAILELVYILLLLVSFAEWILWKKVNSGKVATIFDLQDYKNMYQFSKNWFTNFKNTWKNRIEKIKNANKKK